MKLKQSIKIGKIAEQIGAKLIGDPNMVMTGINEIHKVQYGDITFVDNEKYYKKAMESAATFIIINKEIEKPANKCLLIVDHPFLAYNELAKQFRPFISSQAVISETAKIGEGTVIQPNVFIGNHVKIGKNCIIHANVSIYDYSEIGDNVIIHANTVIGKDAFYVNRRPNHYEKMHTIGRAIIEDNVEIGSLCTIDSGVSGDTIVGMGSKLDSHIHIGHGTVIGRNCLFCAQVAIAGKTYIEDEVILYGKVGISKDLRVGKGARVLASSNVDKSIEGGLTYFGSPVQEAKAAWKEMAILRKLPEIWDRMRQFYGEEALADIK
ncbi:MAG: UDP-3-O-(3-hydroxymyristoyl)glucosamine N-acyltransferase [Bacteroidetes bacterium]|nr:UDP-3-O-(3-hydroxymyristoyl)glucosamine N-acyltransferase [Bacteroidota bacterium]